MPVTRTEKWDRRFLALAEHIAQWSKDPSTKVGAVIVDPENQVVSVGYNGFPRGVKDLPERLEDRDLKYKFTVHGDLNAILSAQRPVRGFRIFLHPFMSCSSCTGAIIQAGLVEVIAPFSDNPRWVQDFEISRVQLEESGIKLTLY